MHGGSEAKKIHLTLIDHPLIRWLWVGGWVGLVGVVIAIWPAAAASRVGATAARRPMP